eukprot:5326488-Amphidinium_carterae.2
MLRVYCASECDLKVKEQCAVYQQPCATHPSHHGTHGLQMATWEAAAACLQEILSSAATNGAPGM